MVSSAFPGHCITIDTTPKEVIMNRTIVSIGSCLLATLFFAACHSAPPMADPPPVAEPYAALDATRPIALIHALLIDGSGAPPIADGMIVFHRGIIGAVGKNAAPPPDCQVVDLAGAAVLPGLVNAHVHNAYYPRHARIFAYSGVTTVRDLHVESPRLEEALRFRDRAAADPFMCRILSAGSLITAPFGYHALDGLSAGTPEEALAKTNMELEAGVDFVKIVFQEPRFPDWANLSPELGRLITDRAHERGVKVTAHIGTARDLEQALDCGVDDIAHLPDDEFPDILIRRMVHDKLPLEPTLTNWATSSGRERETILSNFRRFMDAGGVIALGAEHVHTAKNAGAFVGLPLAEFEMMREGGMEPMKIIVASTSTAAAVCGLEKTLGTLAAGKTADILVLDGNPLADLKAFSKVKFVIHRGIFIRG
jgi:imidazolonepropionase-like amidohydrolase